MNPEGRRGSVQQISPAKLLILLGQIDAAANELRAAIDDAKSAKLPMLRVPHVKGAEAGKERICDLAAACRDEVARARRQRELDAGK